MKKNTGDIQEARALLIRNTRTRKRLDDLYSIAKAVDSLRKDYGSIKELSKDITDISHNMLNRFLSVLNVDKKVLPFIQSRKIDNINAVYYLQGLTPDVQYSLAQLLSIGRLNSHDIRAIAPLARRFPQRNILDIVNQVIASKDKKRYLVKFDNHGVSHIQGIKAQLERILEPTDFEVTHRGAIGTIIFSHFGYRQILTEAKKRKLVYKVFLKSIIN